ncbi:hypothetical protein NL676_014568 [Syzygium grande]|nr:hypothetical protein NL676_014568 [Syzygium grande]
MEGLDRCSANHVPVTPISFLEPSAKVYRDVTSVVYGNVKYTWSETHEWCRRVASALSQLGFSQGDVVASLAPDVPAVYELHFAVPMAGAILCTLNPGTTHPWCICEYEGLVASGSGDFERCISKFHCDISFSWDGPDAGLPVDSAYVPLQRMVLDLGSGGTNMCLRKVSPKGIFDSIAMHSVTHTGGAPTVLNRIVNSAVDDQRPLPRKVEITTGGSPPPPQILFKMEELGFGVNHLYGLTETYGPGTYCAWKPEWDSLPSDQRLNIKSRQGMQHLGLEEVDVRDPVTMKSVPSDGKSLGEILFRGNTVMSGYYKNQEATDKAFEGRWFHSGDLAVKHPDGYIEVKDRLKDVIISGGENISNVEVETVLYSHPAVLEATVVARPDSFWGETPCAFVKLKEECDADA